MPDGGQATLPGDMRLSASSGPCGQKNPGGPWGVTKESSPVGNGLGEADAAIRTQQLLARANGPDGLFRWCLDRCARQAQFTGGAAVLVGSLVIGEYTWRKE